MPYANNDGVNIYYEEVGSGSALLLAHGFGSSGEDWRELGYVDQLIDRHQVIMVDGRGHGKSDKPHDPQSYSAAERVKDHVTVLDHLGISKAHFWGYSSGGVVGFCSAKYAPDRFSSVIIGGLDPYPSDHDIGERSPLTQKAMRGLPEAEAYYRGMQVCSEEMPQTQFVPLQNYGHFDIFANPKAILPHVKNFLDQSAG